ncbi:MAG: Flp pilus assembly protein CpaB [Vibrio sp.]
MNKTQVMLLFLLSVLLGLAAVYFAQKWVKNQTQPEVKIEEVFRSPVVVAIDELGPGHLIEESDLEIKLIEKAWINDYQYEQLDAVVGKVVTSTIFAHEPIVKHRISIPGEGSSLASLISEDKRAVTIRVNDIVGVAGFLLPGNKVDVLNTVNDGNNKANTSTVLKNIKVLAVDQTTKTKSNKPVVVRAVTLEVTPKEAESLLTANSKGDIQLLLRHPLQENEPEPVIVRRVAPKPPTVTIFKGVEPSNIQIRN